MPTRFCWIWTNKSPGFLKSDYYIAGKTDGESVGRIALRMWRTPQGLFRLPGIFCLCLCLIENDRRWSSFMKGKSSSGEFWIHEFYEKPVVYLARLVKYEVDIS